MRKTFFTLLIFTLFSATTLFAHGAEPIKILLVPGHDNEVWGTQFGTVKEANMNLAVGSRIYKLLKKDPRFKVWITRDIYGYTKEFSDYWRDDWNDIYAFRENAKREMEKKIKGGEFIEKENVPHLDASEDTAIRLYGFNKWANENKIDAVIHIHFNDYPRKRSWTIGEYIGFSIYFPDGELSNSRDSIQLATNIFVELDKKYNTSTYPKELGGLIPDQKLIALGSNGTLLATVRSILIEYSYIYEKRLRNYVTRHQAYKDMAKMTATGLKNYFFPK